MKKLLLYLIFLPLIVYSLTECPRFGLVQENIPCLQPSTWHPSEAYSGANCSDYELTFFDSTGDEIINTTWYDYTPTCAFNVTTLGEPGLYCYNSTLETGCISLERANNMLSITLIQIGLVLFFILVGLPFKFGFAKFMSWGMAVIEILITVWMIYIKETGGAITTLLYINAISVLVIGGILGFLSVVMLMAKLTLGQDNVIKDDGYTKFVFDK